VVNRLGTDDRLRRRRTASLTCDGRQNRPVRCPCIVAAGSAFQNR